MNDTPTKPDPLDAIDDKLAEARACIKKAKAKPYDAPAYRLMLKARLQAALALLDGA